MFQPSGALGPDGLFGGPQRGPPGVFPSAQDTGGPPGDLPLTGVSPSVEGTSGPLFQNSQFLQLAENAKLCMERFRRSQGS